MAMARHRISRATRPTASSYMAYFLVIIIMVAAVHTPALAAHSSPPSTLVLYAYRYNVPPDQTSVEVASPSGNLSVIEFGTIIVIADVLRETQAADAPAIGVINGQFIFGKDLNSFFLAATYVLNTTSIAGTISTQNNAITGGTGDFRWARGYLDVATLYQDPRVIVFKIVLHIKYD